MKKTSMTCAHAERSSAPAGGTLYVVATPIGNLGDLSPRACTVLSSVDLIACEDTRHTKNLCRYLNINIPLTSYYREKEQEKAEELLQLLAEGKHIALVSDAGTPAISDPGAILVRKAREAGCKVVAIPGPSALAAALSIAGITQASFLFIGFLPANRAERKHRLHEVRALPFPLVFYESPHRLAASLEDMLQVLGDRPMQLFRELTKVYEECMEGTILSVRDKVKDGLKGEMVVIVQGARKPQAEKPENIEELIRWYRDEQHASLKDTVAAIASDLDLPRSQVYKKALVLWHGQD